MPATDTAHSCKWPGHRLAVGGVFHRLATATDCAQHDHRIATWERAMRATNTTHHDRAWQKRETPGTRTLRKGRVSLPGHVYLVTTVTRGRERVFLDFAAGCAAARCFEDPRILQHTRMLAWVLMPDHVHWLIRLGMADALESVVNRLKSASARKANRALHRSGALWEHAFHDRALRVDEDLTRSARYVIANPLRAGVVKRIGDYSFWNAVWL